jgi:HEPN domain-containing protein
MFLSKVHFKKVQQMKIKNWSKFQHFKDRKPPWVKLYRDLLDDIEWHELDPKAAKVLVMLWLIASEDDGRIPHTKQLAFRLRMSEKDTEVCVSKLFHWLEQDDNRLISSRYQDDAPETETETETETELFVETDRSVVNPKRISCPSEELLNLYHEECKSLPRVLMLNDTRRKHLVSRWRDVDAEDDLKSKEEGIEIFRQIFRQVHKSDFLSGRTQNRNGRAWKASFDWLMMPTNFLKVAEGQYDNGRN